MNKDFSPHLGYQEKWLAVQKDSSAQFGYQKVASSTQTSALTYGYP